MGPIETELRLWAFINGAPALVGGLMFLLAPAVRAITARLGWRLPDWIAWFDVRFAWDIGSQRSAWLLGVGYVFRGLLFVHILIAASWAEVRWIVWGNVLFAAVLLLVTLVWGDRFHWRRPSAIGWLFLYIEEPVWMITIVARAEAFAVEPAGSGLAAPIVAFLLAQAVISALVAGWLFFRRAHEPDPISPRILAGFALGWTGWCWALAMAVRQEDAIWGLALNALWLVGVALVLVIDRRRGPRPFGGTS